MRSTTALATLLARQGVVLLSINYRVGPLGFLAHPELSAESPHHVFLGARRQEDQE
jgi:carboxylesterase type B